MRTSQRAALLCLASATLALSQSGQAIGAPADLASSSESVASLAKRQQLVFPAQAPVSVQESSAPSSNGFQDAWHEVYHDYEGIQAHIQELAARYSNFATVIELGKTYENRSISALKLSLPPKSSRSSSSSPSRSRKLWQNLHWPWKPTPQDEPETKLGLVIAAEAHAREWISSASSLYFAEKVLSLASEYQAPEQPPPNPPTSAPAVKAERKKVHWSRQSWSQLLRRDSPEGQRRRREGRRKAKKHHGKGSAHTKGRKKKGKSGRKHRDSGRHASPMSPSQAYELLEKYSITLVPLSNPDGYAYTWAEGKNRMWRKNRQPSPDGAESDAECVGIDVNRNWDFGFNTSPYPVRDPCSESYAGANPFEALETAALSRYMLDEKNNIKLFFDLHSYGQHVMYPFATSCDEPLPDEEDLAEVALGSAKALRDLHKTSFSTGRICELLFTNWGSSIDWSYAVGHIKWSFAVELRDAGTYGFLLPPEQIKPSGEELTSLLSYMLTFIAKKEK